MHSFKNGTWVFYMHLNCSLYRAYYAYSREWNCGYFPSSWTNNYG